MVVATVVLPLHTEQNVRKLIILCSKGTASPVFPWGGWKGLYINNSRLSKIFQ